MEEKPKEEGELFPEIAEESEKDIVSRRRKSHKKISDILTLRAIGKQRGIRQEMELEKEHKDRIKKILDKKE